MSIRSSGGLVASALSQLDPLRLRRPVSLGIEPEFKAYDIRCSLDDG